MLKSFPNTYSAYFNNIKFWIVLYFIVRLIGITNPPLEMGHSWRQITNYMVERNFLEENNDIFSPRVDDNQGRTGVIGMEFPVLQYMAYLLSLVFGQHFIWGRLLNLIFSSIGIYYFYKIVREFFGEKTALYSSLFLLCSVWFEYGRKFMADTFCISLIFIGIFYCIQFLKTNKAQHYFLFFFFITLAVLAKIPAGVYFSLLLFPLINPSVQISKKILISIAAVVAIVAVYLWYFVWCVSIAVKSGTWYNAGLNLRQGADEIFSNLYDTFEKFYFCSFSSFIILVLFLGGFYLMIKERKKILIVIFILITTTFTFYVLKSGHFFYTQSYYIVPYVPVMALICGCFLASISNKKIVLFFLIAVSLESIANQYHDLLNPSEELYKLKIESCVDKVIPKKELIAVNGGKNPQLLYFTHRKGWTLESGDFNSSILDSLKRSNCHYILMDKHIAGFVSADTSIANLFEDEDVIIGRIKH